MSDKSVVLLGGSCVNEVVCVISEYKAGLSSIHVENCVSISVLEIVSFRKFEVHKSLHLLVIVNVGVSWGLNLLDSLQVSWAWERREDSWLTSLVWVLESHEFPSNVLAVVVFPEAESSKGCSVRHIK